MAKRTSISTRTRFEIFKRDRFTCQYCGRRPPVVTLQVDHVIAVANGGDNSPLNLTTSCCDCNLGKSDVPLTEIPESANQKIGELQERADQLKALNEFLIEERRALDETVERLGLIWSSHYRRNRRQVFSEKAATSVRTFLKHLPELEIQEAIEIAFSRKWEGNADTYATWKYFCGICWKKIRDAQGGGE